MSLTESCKVPAEKLRWHCDPAVFSFHSTAEIGNLEASIGQQRALSAIALGLGMELNGFNIYLAGEAGTGRNATIGHILKKRAKAEPPPPDWCYVYNFAFPDNPIALSLPAGKGIELAEDMKELLEGVRVNIPKVLESKEYENNKVSHIEAFQEKTGELFAALEKEAEEQGFALQRTVSGLVIVPQKEGRNFTQEEYDALEKEERDRMDGIGKELTARLNDVLRQIRENEKGMRESLAQLDRELGLSAIAHHLNPLKEKYATSPRISCYLESVQEDLLESLEEFKPQQALPQLAGLRLPRQEPSFERYQVNVLVQNSDENGAPVIFESNPTYNNLFGRMESVLQMGGTATTSFMMIKPGALHRANGGYLVMDAREVLINPFSWESLKRCIRNAEIKIEDVLEQYRFMTFVALKPEPIPLQAKIIMIGSQWIYYLLYYLEPEYRKFFKVRADFDSRVAISPEVLNDYALFVATHCRNENLIPFDAGAVAELVEHSARIIEDQERLSSQFLELSDLIRESSYWAAKEKVPLVNRELVKKAIGEKIYRNNLMEQRIQELFEDGTILCDTQGSVVGQINGLSVITLGDHTFGRPSRVTTRVYLGRAGMVNIEREVKLSGPIHDKGVLILAGFLGGRFAQDKPLSFSASICFEQSYQGIEGDSASSTELYSLLSSLSGVPIKQGIAVTGSVNQHGQVQPIGGVNYKIEGFYEVCRAKGLTGDQGVIIPKLNERNLMLSDEVETAVREGKFSIWSVEHVDEGIEILTGVPAGNPDAVGAYPEGSINFLVNRKFDAMVQSLKRFTSATDKENKRAEDNPPG